MTRQDLVPFLQTEIDKWSAKSYETLREELKTGSYTDAESASSRHVEIELLENREEYVHVSVAVCHPDVRWSCFHPLSASFLVYSDGRVKKQPFNP